MRNLRLFRLAATALACALMGSSCYNSDDYTLTPGDIDHLLKLSPATGETTVQADGFSRLRLVAQLLQESDQTHRAIVFTTSDGSFDPQKDVKQAVVQADSSGKAFVDLRSSQSIGTVQVQAQVQGIDGLVQKLSVDFVQVDSGDIIYFVQAPSSAKADGITLSTFTVLLNSALPADQRKVAFKTTAGTFAGSGGVEEMVDASNGNLATVQLKSPASPMSGQVSASAGGVTSQASITFTRVKADDLIEFTQLTSSAPADGATRSAFTTEVASSVPADQRLVTFKTTVGTFAVSGGPQEIVLANAARKSVAQLVSPRQITTGIVDAALGSVTRETTIRFVRALPDKAVQVRADPLELVLDPTQPGPQSSIIALLVRNVGKTTPGTSVVFNAYKTGGSTADTVGYFSNVTLSDNQGQVTATYIPGGTTYRGDVTLTARAEDTSLLGSTTVRLVNPVP